MPTCGCENDTFKKVMRILNILCALVIIAVGVLRFILGTENIQAPVVDYALSVYFM